MPSLYAISDLHLRHAANRAALQTLSASPGDWLIVAGDVAESEEHFAFALALFTRKFSQVIWTPGNHELWSLPSAAAGERGVARYERLLTICRGYGVRTPEDPFLVWPSWPRPCTIAPIFTLYDYSFRPAHLSAAEALDWAIDAGVICTDEVLLHSEPYASRAAWCAARCRYSEARLREIDRATDVVLVNHFPLREDLLPFMGAAARMRPFGLWCGTHHTEDWHVRFRAKVVVYGHLHCPTTSMRDGVRFEEVSLGYPGDWDAVQGLHHHLRVILPDAPWEVASTLIEPDQERRERSMQ